jgi:putative DNA primase/helicase
MSEKTLAAFSPPIIENIPEQLTERPQWVVWRLEERDGTHTKVPYVPGTGRKASTIDLMTWRTLKEALEAYETGEPHYDGVGFVLSSADPYCGVDLDRCRDPESGEIEPWAQLIIAKASEGYVEVSPSGTGLHIIIEGRVREGGMKKGPIEMYSEGRYLTVTGDVLS